jgi:hypothetical protein
MIALLRLFDALVLVGSMYTPGFRTPWRLSNAVGNVIDRVEPGHVLFLQIIYSVAFALREHSHENVCACHLLAAGGLNVNRRPLQYALKACCRLRVVAVRGDEVAELVIDIAQNLAAQPTEVDTASTQYSDRVLILDQRQQQMFERGIFVPALIGAAESPMQRLFEIA